ncbi:MAG TPA: hypothetical protein VIZ17_09400 [Acetobacteraceae bacterium]
MQLQSLTRSVVLALTVALTACTFGSEEPPAAQALDFSYLTPLPLNVATLNVESQYVPSGVPPDVSRLDPISPVQALEQMAQQRLKPVGPTGQAVFTVNNASMVQTGNVITGVMSVTLSIYPSPGVRAGYAQATVTRQISGVEGDLAGPLADLTRNLIDQMNVEFEYRVRQALGRWVLSPGATAAPVQQVPLQPPGSPSYAAPPPPMPPSGSQPPGYQPPGYQPPGYQPPGAAGLPVPLSPPGSLPEPVTQPPPPEPSLPYTPPPPASMAPSVAPPASPPLPYTPPPAAPLPQPGPPAAPPSPGLPPLGPVQD